MKRYLELILYKALAELKAESARTYLSFLWWVFEPLMNMAIFYVVFGLLYRRSEADFVPFLLIGLTVWNGYANTIRHGAGAILDNHPLMRQTYLPKILFPLVVVIQDGVKFAIVFGLLLVFLWIYGFVPTPQYLALPIVMGVLWLLTVSCTLLVAAIIPFVPDLRFVVESLLQLAFFVSGVFFSGGSIPERYQGYFYWNPMAALIESFRDVLMHAAWPDWYLLGRVVVISIVMLMFASLLFHRWDRIYPKVVLR